MIYLSHRSYKGVKERIVKDVPGADVEVFRLDLSIKESVMDFCDQVRRNNDKIHVLINNAAIVSRQVVVPPLEITGLFGTEVFLRDLARGS